MLVEKVEVNILAGFTENCYIVSEERTNASAADTHTAKTSVIVVDPGAEVEKICAAVGDRTINSIVLTHRHDDHIGALYDLQKATGAAILAHSLDAKSISGEEKRIKSPFFKSLKHVPIDRMLSDGDTISLGASQLTVLHTPGHTIGSICLYDACGGVLISGDTIFFRALGRTDLPTGSVKQQLATLRTLAKLPDATIIYPGHDQNTSIGYEKQSGVLQGITSRD